MCQEKWPLVCQGRSRHESPETHQKEVPELLGGIVEGGNSDHHLQGKMGDQSALRRISHMRYLMICQPVEKALKWVAPPIRLLSQVGNSMRFRR